MTTHQTTGSEAWRSTDVTPEVQAHLLAAQRLAQQFEADAETPEELALYDVPAPDEFRYDDPSEVPASLIDAERAATCPCGLCVSWRMGVAL